ncbi:zf-HC2 domain-containing protein [Kribbella sp.]|uniref:zf-HC2 domain-containing protein n=1 Tax=Kribbella sp. TaxID=1871183 RepID=UPI002D6C0AB5|nr:zf-HC2 domain-containing protein [Kribbella sp.]HZX02485.1 zf-HC2 domain-containing protein [Kribbella sp.]
MSEHDRTQLGAYALGALEPAEAAEVEAHLATCAECQDELAELTELKNLLGEVPPEAFLDGPPENGELMLQRTLREARAMPPVELPAPTPVKRRSPWLLIAAAAVVVAGALGGGVAIGRSSTPSSDQTVAGSRQVTTVDTNTGARMATTVEPRTGWSWVQVHVSGLKAGDQCEMVVTDKAGYSWVAGSWLVSEKAAKNGSTFGGGVLVPLDQVHTVEIRTVQGQHVVTATL